MAISPISGGGASGLFEMYAQKIKANQSATSANKASESTENEDDYTRILKELQRQLRIVMEQIRRVQASNASAEQKAQQVQMLNTQAVAIQGQIQKVLAAQLKKLQQQAPSAG